VLKLGEYNKFSIDRSGNRIVLKEQTIGYNISESLYQDENKQTKAILQKQL